jgi:beta-lactamase class D
MKIFIVLIAFISFELWAGLDLKSEFGNRDACLIMTDLSSAKTVIQYNQERCNLRLSPCSSFKIPIALMAFEQGILKAETQVIKWDGKVRGRKELNQDQTPLTWMSHSAMWVTQWITPQLGSKAITNFLDKFVYGNKDVSGGIIDAWQTSTLKISAYEQLNFISKLWTNELPVSKRAVDLTKRIIFIKDLDNGSKLYGKTGTGCLQGRECMNKPDKMIGWFVGVVENGNKRFAFVANASDLKPEKMPAGPRLRQTVIEIIEKWGVANR